MDAGDAMFAFGGMFGETDISVDPLNIEEEGTVRLLTVLCLGKVLVLAVCCCWGFTQLISNSVSTGFPATDKREKFRADLHLRQLCFS